ncbi:MULTISPECIES: ABC transporter ATP-binding protein [Acidianus]|nr:MULTISPECIES: ABC transporter ATP-binding protein [Acidianus]NON62900.1 ABC transporter ATP-binding protein [Acidianus sp. RZ1]
MEAIKVEDLWKYYDEKEVLKGLTFSVNEGEIFSILGPNGAGKTTTVKILSCIDKPTRGKIEVLGYSIPSQCQKIRESVGIVPQEFQGFSDLSVKDNARYFAELYGKGNSSVEETLSKLGLIEYANTRFKKLSGGYKRRVAIACALVGKPSLIYLDEPTVGLDPKSRRDLWNTIKELKNKGITVLLTTHYLDEAQKLSDKVAIMYNGKIIRSSTPELIMKEFEKSSLEEAYLALMESLGEE